VGPGARRSKPIAELPRREQPKKRAVNLTKKDLEADGRVEKNDRYAQNLVGQLEGR
jgi:hypothetical protein